MNCSGGLLVFWAWQPGKYLLKAQKFAFKSSGSMNCNESHLVKQGCTGAGQQEGKEIVRNVRAEFKVFIHLTPVNICTFYFPTLISPIGLTDDLLAS